MTARRGWRREVLLLILFSSFDVGGEVGGEGVYDGGSDGNVDGAAHGGVEIGRVAAGRREREEEEGDREEESRVEEAREEGVHDLCSRIAVGMIPWMSPPEVSRKGLNLRNRHDQGIYRSLGSHAKRIEGQ